MWFLLGMVFVVLGAVGLVGYVILEGFGVRVDLLGQIGVMSLIASVVCANEI